MICTELINLIEVNNEIFIIWIFYSWLKIAFLILKNYWCNSNCINCIRFINIEYVQLKLLTFKNSLILISILRVLFIAEIITSTADENISNTVNYFWLINDIEIEFWKKLISAGLMTVELTNNNKVFQIFIINEHNYRVSSIINFKILLLKCFNNDQ